MAVRRMSGREKREKPERKQAPKTTNEVKHYEIHRLLQYPQVKNVGSTAEVEFIGEFAPGASIEDEIDQRYGQGWYRVTERLVNGKLGHSWMVRGRDVEDDYQEMPIEQNGQPVERERVIIKPGRSELTNPIVLQSMIEATAQRTAEVVRQQNPGPAQPNSFDDTLAQIERLEKVKERLSPKLEQPVQTVTVASADKPLEEKLFEVAVTKLLEKADESSLDRVVDLLRPQKEPTFVETLGEIAKPFLPLVAQVVTGYIHAQQAGQVAPVSNGVTAQLPAAPPQATAETGPASTPNVQSQPQPVVDPVQKGWLRVVRRMIEDLIDDVDVNASVDRFLGFLEKHPTYQGMVGQLIVSAPGDVFTALAPYAPGLDFSKVAHAESWIADFQQAIREAGEEGEPDQGQESEQAGVAS